MSAQVRHLRQRRLDQRLGLRARPVGRTQDAAQLAALPFNSMRFYCHTSAHARKIHALFASTGALAAGVSVPRSRVIAERSNSGALGSSAAGASGVLVIWKDVCSP